MIPNSIINILFQFGDLLKTVKSLNAKNENLDEVANDIKLLKLWREEVESDKQSIYIIGKTSTGKSEFHNFLLDIESKKEAIFKTSTKVETGIIQTLEHCQDRMEAHAEIIIRDKNELNKLHIPTHLTSFLDDNTLIFPLVNLESVVFFRDNIIAKSDNSSSFDLIKAVERVNIKFPLKYLKRHRIIDTPGLASSISITDVNVKEQFHGKSCILWFIDGSKRTISDSLTLLSKEKELVKSGVDRISFIVNKFDLMEYDDDVKTEEVVLKRIQELTDSLNQELLEISKKEKSGIIYFTSFKKPKKYFAKRNTIQVIKELEDSLIFIEKESRHKNIHSLITVLATTLNRIKENVIESKLKSIRGEINDLDIRRKEKIKLRNDSLGIGEDTLRVINKAKNSIINIKKEDKLNTRAKFYSYLGTFETQIRRSCQEIDNSVSRIENLKLNNYKQYMLQLKRVKRFTFNEEESIWKKYVVDSELKQRKSNLERYVKEKLESFDALYSILQDNINMELDIEVKEFHKRIQTKKAQLRYCDKQLKFISETEDKIIALDTQLLADIEKRVSKWKPGKTDENFSSFLDLYSLLQEHDIVEKNIKENG